MEISSSLSCVFYDDYFTREDLTRKLLEIDRSINSLKTHCKSLDFDQKRLQVEVNNVIETFQDLPEMYEKSDLEKKAKILKEMADCIIIKEGKAAIQWEKPFIFLMKDSIYALNEQVVKQPGIRLADNDITLTTSVKRPHKKRTFLVNQKRPLILPREDSIRTR